MLTSLQPLACLGEGRRLTSQDEMERISVQQNAFVGISEWGMDLGIILCEPFKSA